MNKEDLKNVGYALPSGLRIYGSKQSIDEAIKLMNANKTKRNKEHATKQKESSETKEE